DQRPHHCHPDADHHRLGHHAAPEDRPVRAQRWLGRPEQDQAAVLSDLGLARQARRYHRDERVDHQQRHNGQDQRLATSLKERGLLHPRRTLIPLDHRYTPSCPSRWASLLAESTSTIPTTPLTMPAAAVTPHCPPRMPWK